MQFDEYFEQNLINFGLFGHIVIFGSFLETNAHQEIANDFGLAFETLQVHGTIQSTHQSVTSCGLSFRTQAF